jgi:hypothetical protein
MKNNKLKLHTDLLCDGIKAYPTITRVEIIRNDEGRVFTEYSAKDVEISLQDDGRTLKIFYTKETK